MESIPEQKTPILVVDDDRGLLLSVKTALVSNGMPEPALTDDGNQALQLLSDHDFQVILIDLIMPTMHGLDLLQKIKEKFPQTECIIVTAVDDTPSAVQAMKYGAYDYLVKPLENEKLILTINHAIERYSLRQGLALHEKKHGFAELKNPKAFENIVANDESMALLFHKTEIIAPTEYNVIITGESGTGKELLARTIHGLSNRASGPFVAINMAARSATLIEDDLFGHDKGAYTGALQDKKGFFEEARGGTLFLDEISELDASLQAKLLRVIQEREYHRLGSTVTWAVDVRVIASTNKDLDEEIRRGEFRQDLFYRLNQYRLNIPPLRERGEDILVLADHFLKLHAKVNNKPMTRLSIGLAERLRTYPFPGNVRELENVIAAAVLMENGKELSLGSAQQALPRHELLPRRQDDFMTLAEWEMRYIFRVLEATGNNKTRAAKILGIGLRTLQRKLKEYELK